ncbi:kojibiose phosphorylase [Listeria floridensis FSL S10-1187]|uniref:Kojibiose phosphorylase n=1 Tax=Listeria floridensis FSL S10-1187 TaxID=1265817 RepID=A0ABN0RIK0_9LIST|nr:glycosyl hydrolase family 65 protein [Listeria floridensis]EUJ33700.1 kojibiose phosphorylase [Listeria floridensis FSL S10-1187]
MNWQVTETGFKSDKQVNFGNKFLIGNGYMGVRGTMEEARKAEFPAVNLLGVYDQKGDLWREPVNAPNGFFTELVVDGEACSVTQIRPTEHRQSLELKSALHKRNSRFTINNGDVHIWSERFVSSADVHIAALKYVFRVPKGSEVVLKTGIDGDVWDINGPHFAKQVLVEENGTLTAEATTGELGHKIVVAEQVSFDFEADEEIVREEMGVYRIFRFTASSDRDYELTKFISVYTSVDLDAPLHAAKQAVRSVAERGYESLLDEHAAVFGSRFAEADVEIDGDDEAELALRYSIYHLLIIAPHHSNLVSIPARGLSGQTYKGAIFWDTEMFMLPFYLYTDASVAEHLMHYRVHTLDGARKKAAEYGYRGAFYAWESQEDGRDACSDFNVTDVFTGRPMRTYFRDKQVHISAAVVHGLWQSYQFSGNDQILLDGGAEVILECARFYYSYAYYNSDLARYEIIDVIGPDEYHERVYNNAYTSKMVDYTLQTALKTVELLQEKYPDFYEELFSKLALDDDLLKLKEMKEQLYVPEPCPETGLVEQFDGYFKLEDASLEEVRKRVLDPKEYWGGAYGVASDTQILKQADVVLMLNLFKEEYSAAVKRSNWEYYEPRTEHGSSLSPCIYALLACEIGNEEWAYPYFMKTASVDLTGESKQFAGTIYIGGTHPAANGGAWMAAVLGFGGLKMVNGEVSLSPHLPKKWARLAFNVTVRGVKYRAEITQEGSKLWQR